MWLNALPIPAAIRPVWVMVCCGGRLKTRVHWWMSYGGSWPASETSWPQVSGDLVHLRQNLDNEIDSSSASVTRSSWLKHRLDVSASRALVKVNSNNVTVGEASGLSHGTQRRLGWGQLSSFLAAEPNANSQCASFVLVVVACCRWFPANIALYYLSLWSWTRWQNMLATCIADCEFVSVKADGVSDGDVSAAKRPWPTNGPSNGDVVTWRSSADNAHWKRCHPWQVATQTHSETHTYTQTHSETHTYTHIQRSAGNITLVHAR